ETQPEGEDAAVRDEAADEPADADVARPGEDVALRRRTVGLPGDDDPADGDERRQEGDDEHGRRHAPPAPLGPAAEKLRERHHEPRAGEDPVDGPVAADRMV